MLATFCMRLASGLAGALLLLPSSLINPRFFRTHFLTILALTAAAAAAERQGWGVAVWASVAAAAAAAFLGSASWSLEGAPGGRILTVVTAAALLVALVLSALDTPGPGSERPGTGGTVEPGFRRDTARPSGLLLIADSLTSAAVLGTSMTAMLVGHSYLIAPTMSLTPLTRLLHALFAALVVRLALAGLALWSWTSHQPPDKLEEAALLWLVLRWVAGFLFPLGLGWMARETAKIRSTQSATGILYVVVVFCFVGELVSQLLLRKTGSIL